MLCLVIQSCLTLCDSMDCSPLGFSVHGDSSGKDTRVHCHALLQGVFPKPGTEPRSPAFQADSLSPEPPGKPLMWYIIWQMYYCTPFEKPLTKVTSCSKIASMEGQSVNIFMTLGLKQVLFFFFSEIRTHCFPINYIWKVKNHIKFWTLTQIHLSKPSTIRMYNISLPS